MNTDKTLLKAESQPYCLCAVIGRASHKIEMMEKIDRVLFSIEGKLEGSIEDFYLYFGKNDPLLQDYSRLKDCYETYKHKIKYDKSKIENLLKSMEVELVR